MILAPLTIPIEKHVVIDIVDGLAQTDLLHLPAPVHMARLGDGRTIATRFGDRMERGFPPASWPAACGAFTHGSIYVQAGPLADKAVCPECKAAVRPKPRPRRHQGAWQLTSEHGADGLWHVRRGGTTTTLCAQSIRIRTGRKWPPTCVACIESGRALGITVPPAWGWSSEAAA